MSSPLVSVICLCYNHAPYLTEAIESVINQTYKSVQLIVVDDASTDNSLEVIEELTARFPELKFIKLEKNVGNCAAFNIGLASAKGKYIIDFATDDIMIDNRIEKQVAFFESLEDNVGVIFSDAIYVDEKGKTLRNHFEYLFRKKLITKIPEGNVYREVLTTYFIPSPTMMVRKEVFNVLQGYDESLDYEDFDFWVRSSRLYKYKFLNEPLTKIRRTGKSMSAGWYQKGDKQLHSTYLICRKAISLNRDGGDNEALLVRIRYEIIQSILSQNNREATLFFDLLKKMKMNTPMDRVVQLVNSLNLPLRYFRGLYHSIRFN